MTTKFDELREELRNKLLECRKTINEMLDSNVWGYEDMKSDYIDELYDISIDLHKIKSKI